MHLAYIWRVPLSNQPQGSFTTLTIIWAAITGSVVMFGIIGFIIAGNGTATFQGNLKILIVMFATVSLIEIGIAKFMYKLHVRAAVKMAKEAGKSWPLSDVEISGYMITPFIIKMALYESVAVYGLVLTYLSSDIKYFVPFAIAALGMMITERPQMGRMRAQLQVVWNA
jgi:hypothetical protein